MNSGTGKQMPCTVNFAAMMNAPGGVLRVIVDADGDGSLEAAENYAMFPAGTVHSRLVQLAANAPAGTSFVLKIAGPAGAEVTLAAQDEAGGLVYQTVQPVVVPAGGQTWLAGTLH